VSACCINDDPADVYDEAWPVARKEHRCCECSSTIKPGEAYQRVTQLYDGMWEEYKTCELCADLRESLDGVTCVYFEGLSEAFTDYLIEAPGVVTKVKRGTHAAKLVPAHFVEAVK